MRLQFGTVHAAFSEAVKQISPAEWVARPYAGANLLGFTAWHVPAAQDWALHTWMRGVPEIRGAPDRNLPGINPPFAPFGMSMDEADGIARAVSPGDVLAYADAVLVAANKLFDGMTDADLERVGDKRTWGVRTPQHQTPGYLEEVDDMYDMPAWRVLTGPCFGNARGHVGEMYVILEMLRAR